MLFLLKIKVTSRHPRGCRGRPWGAPLARRGSAPSGFQGSASLREAPPSFASYALDGLFGKIHPRARPATPDHPACWDSATLRCGTSSLPQLLRPATRVVRPSRTRALRCRRMLRTLTTPWTGYASADRKNWPGGHFSSPPAWARWVSVLVALYRVPTRFALRNARRALAGAASSQQLLAVGASLRSAEAQSANADCKIKSSQQLSAVAAFLRSAEAQSAKADCKIKSSQQLLAVGASRWSAEACALPARFSRVPGLAMRPAFGGLGWPVHAQSRLRTTGPRQVTHCHRPAFGGLGSRNFLRPAPGYGCITPTHRLRLACRMQAIPRFFFGQGSELETVRGRRSMFPIRSPLNGVTRLGK